MIAIIRSPICIAIAWSVSGVASVTLTDSRPSADVVAVRRDSSWDTSAAGPSMVWMTCPEVSCWATTMSGRLPRSLAWTCTRRTGRPSMWGTLRPASLCAPSHDIVRHMPSNCRPSPGRGDSSGLSSSTGAGSITASLAARMESSRALRAAAAAEAVGRRPSYRTGVGAAAGGRTRGAAGAAAPPESAGASGRGAGAAAAGGPSRLASDAVRPGPTSALAVQPRPTAATRLAAQAPMRSRRRRVCTRAAASSWSVSKAGGRRRGGARVESRAVVRSRSAAIASRLARQDGQAARWLSISTH